MNTWHFFFLDSPLVREQKQMPLFLVKILPLLEKLVNAMFLLSEENRLKMAFYPL